MEAWMLGTPVVVHARCAVTKHHVVESQGGLYFSSMEDFAGVAERLLADASLRNTMARNGRRYVQSEYSWEAVVRRFDEVTAALVPELTGGVECEAQ
jgi:glycosyltransferase involved in cell wall biosynthesis